MPSVDSQIQSADLVITRAIETYDRDRAFLSQVVLAHLRNLVEGIAVRIINNKVEMRAQVRRLPAKYDFPPNLEERAVELALQQAELFASTEDAQ